MRETEETDLSRTVPQSPGEAPWQVSADDRQQPALRLGRYLLLDRLGEGAMGVVHSAYDPELDRRVAIKVLHPGVADPDARRRLQREAQAMARLSHPHVVTVYDVGTLGDNLFIAMELVSGGDLGSWLDAGPQPWPEVVRVFLQAGQGLEAAHRAGLVHRDFKPENVLLGPRGRARVTDFGLARSDSEILDQVRTSALQLSELDSGSTAGKIAAKSPGGIAAKSPGGIAAKSPGGIAAKSQVLDSDITATGALLGTPAYMAPELFEGQAADAKTDQFSFCVALWQGLYGVRPFRGKNLPALMKAILRGKITDPPKSTVPPWLHQILVRGLASDPDDRWPSMSDLLDALRDDPKRRQLRLGAVALASLLVLLLGMVWWRGAEAERRSCQQDRLVGVWDGPRRAGVETALTTDGSPFAAATWHHVGPALDGYADRWSDLYGRFCEAHRRGEGTAALYDRRVACLDGRRASLRALAELLSHGETDITRGAARAVAELPTLDRCADTEALLSSLPSPTEASRVERVTQLREDLAEVSVMLSAGMPGLAEEALESLVPEARAIDYPPLLAEVLRASGRVAAHAYDLPRAEEVLLEAWEVALSVDHTEMTFEVAQELLRIYGVQQSRFDEADFWLRNLTAVSQRLAGQPRIRGRYLRTLGLLTSRRGETARALEIFEEALEVGVEQGEEGSLPFARTLNLLGSTHARLGQYEEALVEFQRTHQLLAEILGERHPDVAGTLLNLGNIYGALGRYDEERRALHQGLAIFREFYGEDHVLVGQTLANLGASALSSSDPRPGEAVGHLEGALEILRSKLGEGHGDVARTLNYLGQAQWGLAQRDAARQSFEQALEIFEGAGLSEHPFFATTLGRLGELALEEGRPGEALPHLERALVLRQREGADPVPEAETQFLLARALWQLGERARAERLARGAFELFLGAEQPPQAGIDAIRQWFDDRGLAFPASPPV